MPVDESSTNLVDFGRNLDTRSLEFPEMHVALST